jgi:predicted esterase
MEVVRTARFARVGGEGGAVDQLWIACHGYGQLARFFLRGLRHLAGPGRLLAAPEGLSRFYLTGGEGRPHGAADRVGATWMTREDRESEIRDYIRYLDRFEALLRSGLAGGGPGPWGSVVLGFSQGAHTAARWVALGGARPGHLILWGAGLPPDLELSALSDTLRACGGQVTLVRGEGDAAHSDGIVDRDLATLAEAGVSADVRTHPGGHRLDPELLRDLAGGVGLV